MPAAIFGALALGLVAGRSAQADVEHRRATVDRTVVRFFSPETGGSARPGFVYERVLALEARLEVMAEQPEGIGDGYDEHRVRVALDHHVGEEMLASLARKLISGMPPDRRPSEAALQSIQSDLSAALFDRLGGEARVEAAVAAEQLERSEFDDLLRRQALAAWYVHRALTPIFEPTDEQLREVFRAAAHPYRGRSFEEVRLKLARWFVSERLRVAETSFLQAARARVKIVVTQ